MFGGVACMHYHCNLPEVPRLQTSTDVILHTRPSTALAVIEGLGTRLLLPAGYIEQFHGCSDILILVFTGIHDNREITITKPICWP